MHRLDMDDRFYETAMSFFVEAGHITNREPEYFNLSTDQITLDEDEHDDALLERFDNLSLLFVIRQCMFFSAELMTDRKHRSQVACDVHELIHSRIETKASVCVFLSDGFIVFSFMGYGGHCVLSDWYDADDVEGIIHEKLDISNVSLKSDYEYFCDLTYNMARDYYRHKEELLYSAFPVDGINRLVQEKIYEDELETTLRDNMNSVLDQYGYDFVEYENPADEPAFDSAYDLLEMAHVMDDIENNPFGEVIEREEKDDNSISEEETQEKMISDDHYKEMNSSEYIFAYKPLDPAFEYVWVGAELVKIPINKRTVESEKKQSADHGHNSFRVQSFITNITFPQTLDELLDIYIDDREEFDLESVLSGDPGAWTAPKWAKQGDIIFFMHSASAAKKNITTLTSQLKKNMDDYSLREVEEMTEWLERGRELNKIYGGKIFALGRLANNPEYYDSDDEYVHYGARLFADVEDCWVLDNPVDIADFRDFILISRFSATTRIYGGAFDKLRSLILGRNPNPPEYFAKAIVSQKL